MAVQLRLCGALLALESSACVDCVALIRWVSGSAAAMTGTQPDRGGLRLRRDGHHDWRIINCRPVRS
jgi:hypothetical protein